MNRRMLPALGVMIVAMAAPAPAADMSAAEKFAQANRFYAAGQYEEAAAAYQELVQAAASGEVYFNLANSFHYLGKKGLAIVNYERAARLMPQDEDVQFNLSFERSLLDQAQPDEGLNFAESVWRRAREAAGAGWVWWALSFWLAACGVTAAAVFLRRQRKIFLWAASLLAAGCAVSLIFYAGHMAGRGEDRPAIVVKPKLEIRYSPSQDGAVAFELTEGLRVRVVRTEEGWTQIRLSKDKSGWAEPGSVEGI